MVTNSLVFLFIFHREQLIFPIIIFIINFILSRYKSKMTIGLFIVLHGSLLCTFSYYTWRLADFRIWVLFITAIIVLTTFRVFNKFSGIMHIVSHSFIMCHIISIIRRFKIPRKISLTVSFTYSIHRRMFCFSVPR